MSLALADGLQLCAHRRGDRPRKPLRQARARSRSRRLRGSGRCKCHRQTERIDEVPHAGRGPDRSSIGGIVEIAPLFYLENTIEKVDGVGPTRRSSLPGATSTSARGATLSTAR